MGQLQREIEELWLKRDHLDPTDPVAMSTVRQAVSLLDRGRERVAYIDPKTDEVVVNSWLKQAILLFFKLSQVELAEAGPFEFADKVPLKSKYRTMGVRVVPGASVRWGAYLEEGVVLMPSFVNIGARVGANTMVDTWATVGSCAQIGANVHLSGGVGIGGVLEPPQAAPVIIEDDVFVGSRCVVVEGARVRKGAKLGAGIILSASIPVIDVETGDEIARGEIPERCVAIPGTRPKTFKGGEFGLPCVLVVRRMEEGEQHDKLKLESILREYGSTF